MALSLSLSLSTGAFEDWNQLFSAMKRTYCGAVHENRKVSELYRNCDGTHGKQF
eukprot:jgi/Psemu1/303954/fgenesh1_kg.130_\